MKSILYYLSIIIFSIGCFCACDQDNCFTTEPNDGINSTLIEEAEYLCLPIDVVKNLSPEAKQSRISSFIIAEHISIQGSEQRINITEEEALKLGVPSHHYRYAENYLNSLNQLTKNSKDIINIKEYVQEAKRRKYYCPTANTKSNISRGAIRDDYLIGTLESDYGKADSVRIIANNKEAYSILLSNTFEVEKTRNDLSAYPAIVFIESLSPVEYRSERFKVEFESYEFLKGGKVYTSACPSKWDHSFIYKLTCLGAYCTLSFLQS